MVVRLPNLGVSPGAVTRVPTSTRSQDDFDCKWHDADKLPAETAGHVFPSSHRLGSVRLSGIGIDCASPKSDNSRRITSTARLCGNHRRRRQERRNQEERRGKKGRRAEEGQRPDTAHSAGDLCGWKIYGFVNATGIVNDERRRQSLQRAVEHQRPDRDCLSQTYPALEKTMGDKIALGGRADVLFRKHCLGLQSRGWELNRNEVITPASERLNTGPTTASPTRGTCRARHLEGVGRRRPFLHAARL